MHEMERKLDFFQGEMIKGYLKFDPEIVNFEAKGLWKSREKLWKAIEIKSDLKDLNNLVTHELWDCECKIECLKDLIEKKIR